MQAMIPATPAPAKAATKAPKAPSSPASSSQGKKSFSKQLDRAESRREQAQGSQQNREARQTDQKQTCGETSVQQTQSRDKTPKRITKDGQQHKSEDQQAGAIMGQEIPNQPQLLEKLLQSLSVPGEEGSVVQGDFPVTTTQQTPRQGKEQILTTLLDQVTSGSRQGGQDTDNLVSKLVDQPVSGTNEEKGAIIVDTWQARFSYKENAPGMAPETEKPEISGLQKGVRVQVTPEMDEQLTPPTRAASGTSLEGAHQPRDTASNYIHSNLPGVQTNNGGDKGAALQQEGQSSPEQNMAEHTDKTQNTPTMQSQDTPLIFSLDQAGQQGGVQAGRDGMQMSSLRLPSGTEVPHSHIVNQVADHFSVDRNLESGSVVLRLHPAELGELRMEIKVEQDNIKAHITTHNPQVQDILDRNIPKLKEVLEQQGMNLEQIQVTVAADNGDSGQLFQEQFEQNRFNGTPRRNTHQVNLARHDEEVDIPITNPDEQSLSVHA